MGKLCHPQDVLITLDPWHLPSYIYARQRQKGDRQGKSRLVLFKEDLEVPHCCLALCHLAMRSLGNEVFCCLAVCSAKTLEGENEYWWSTTNICHIQPGKEPRWQSLRKHHGLMVELEISLCLLKTCPFGWMPLLFCTISGGLQSRGKACIVVKYSRRGMNDIIHHPTFLGLRTINQTKLTNHPPKIPIAKEEIKGQH